VEVVAKHVCPYHDPSVRRRLQAAHGDVKTGRDNTFSHDQLVVRARRVGKSVVCLYDGARARRAWETASRIPGRRGQHTVPRSKRMSVAILGAAVQQHWVPRLLGVGGDWVGRMTSSGDAAWSGLGKRRGMARKAEGAERVLTTSWRGSQRRRNGCVSRAGLYVC
jgi:hypothetical protein